MVAVISVTDVGIKLKAVSLTRWNMGMLYGIQ